jgi:hypothetical protein
MEMKSVYLPPKDNTLPHVIHSMVRVQPGRRSQSAVGQHRTGTPFDLSKYQRHVHRTWVRGDLPN